MLTTSLLAATTGMVALVSSVIAQSSATVPRFTYGAAQTNYPEVVATQPNGETNPDRPSLGTPINQTSLSRLVTVNSIDDWCTFSSPDGKTIAETEPYVVAYCTKARNNARVIPDGTITAVHFIRTPLYVQVMALGDFTRIGMQAGDDGGELDPHGAHGTGNPIGGNVTSDISGQDVFYQEWMNFMSYSQMCIRICIAGSPQAPTRQVCQHTLDVMGCYFVMPGNYSDNVFESCDADAAYPPGLYPEGNGQTSTFQQYFSSVYTDTANGNRYTFVNAEPDQTTPTAAYSLPASSNCVFTNTIANNIAQIMPTSSVSSSSSSASSTGQASGSTSQSNAAGSQTTSGTASSGTAVNNNTSGAAVLGFGQTAVAMTGLLGGLVAVLALL